jgi:hypothetical protein
MLYTSINPLVQVNSGKRLNKKLPVDRLPIVSPALISKAAAIARRRLRHQSRLDTLALTSLIVFAWQANHCLSELKNTALRNGYVYEYTGPHDAIAYIPADYFYTKVLNATIRLQTLLEYHQSSLSTQAAIALKEALEWHLKKCKEMWMQREGLAALSVH